MNRRSILKSLFLGTPASAPPVERAQTVTTLKTEGTGISDKRWYVFSEREGRQELLAGKKRLNWQIKNGELICLSHLPDVTAFLSDYRLSGEGKSFKAEMSFLFNSELIDQPNHGLHVGFRISSTGNIEEVPRHIDAGLSGDGFLFIGDEKCARLLKQEILREPLRLALSVIAQSSGSCFAKLRAFDRSGNTLATLSSTRYTSSGWQGNVGVFSHFTGTSVYDQPSVVISDFKIDGEKLVAIALQDEHRLHNSEIKSKY